MFFNPQLLHNIYNTKTTLHIHCNAGIATMNQQGGYRTVWYHPQGLATILSLSQAKEKFPITYDST